MRRLSRVLTAGTFLLIGVVTPASAQDTSQKEPDAMAALTKMGGYLRTLKAFQVEAVTSDEDVLEDGQKVQFDGVTHLLARMPDRLLVSVSSDRQDRDFFYDGKQFTLWIPQSSKAIEGPVTESQTKSTNQLENLRSES